jgi:hypothetical protein
VGRTEGPWRALARALTAGGCRRGLPRGAPLTWAQQDTGSAMTPRTHAAWGSCDYSPPPHRGRCRGGLPRGAANHHHVIMHAVIHHHVWRCLGATLGSHAGVKTAPQVTTDATAAQARESWPHERAGGERWTMAKQESNGQHSTLCSTKRWSTQHTPVNRMVASTTERGRTNTCRAGNVSAAWDWPCARAKARRSPQSRSCNCLRGACCGGQWLPGASHAPRRNV